MKKKNVTRVDLENNIHKNLGFSKLICKKITQDFFDVVKEFVNKNKQLKIAKFGTFQKKYKNERIGRNPKTKELKNISARNVIKFKPSGYLINEVNKKNEE
tara:strand:+ start:982 stop:1284 length:303 start_codon:yes stop_codon:yes gene_type:complete